MAAYTLAPNSTWFSKKEDTTINRKSITEIHILDTTYVPIGDYILWDASEDDDGSVICYVEDTILTIARNSGTGKIYANEDSSFLFYDATGSSASDREKFENVSAINGLQNLDTSKAITFMAMFGHLYKVASLPGMDNWDVSNVTSLRSLFTSCGSLTSVSGIENWDVSNVTNMRQLFCKCISLEYADELMAWKDKTHNLVDAYGIFQGYNNWTEKEGNSMSLLRSPLDDWDMSNVVYIDYVFYGCGRLTSLNLNKWNTSKFFALSHLFSDCRSLVNLQLSNWDVSNVQTFNATFNECTKLEVLDLSGWVTSSAKRFPQMFEGCSKLKKIMGIEKFITTALDTYAPIFDPITGEVYSEGQQAFQEMFRNCGELEELDLSSFRNPYGVVEGYIWMFANCTKLKTIYVSDLWSGRDKNHSGAENIFLNCQALIGQNGTTYSSEHITIDYAKVDGKDGTPGYFTLKNTNKPEKVVVNIYVYGKKKERR